MLLVGAGNMTKEYLKVLNSLDISPIVVCRSKSTAKSFFEHTGHKAIHGGIRAYLESSSIFPKSAIVTVSVENLTDVTLDLLEFGIKKILIEKPASLYLKGIKKIKEVSKKKKANCYVAYNRRFYASTQKAKKIIQADGGVISFNFDFTEKSEIIKPLKKGKKVKERWFLSNSSHVVDLAFFLGGKPKKIETFTEGSGRLSWHPVSSVFCGSGVTEEKALFSYFANWVGPGGWGISLTTRKNTLILKPLEELRVLTQEDANLKVLKIDDELDKKYKPGLYKQVEAFIYEDKTDLCSISSQVEAMNIFKKISNYVQ
jgi:predicted dehydrogenase